MEFAQIIQSDTVLVVDVRTAEEYNAGHIEGARNIDVLKDNFQTEAMASIPKDKTVAVYCRSGKRKLKAAAIHTAGSSPYSQPIFRVSPNCSILSSIAMTTCCEKRNQGLLVRLASAFSLQCEGVADAYFA